MLRYKIRDVLRRKRKNNSFTNVTRFALLFIRCAGFLPLAGIESNRSDKLRFQIKSPYTLFFISSWMGQILPTVLSTLYAVKKSSPRVFYKAAVSIISLLMSFKLLHLAFNWAKVVQHITEVEDQLPTGRNRRLRGRVNLVIGFFFTLYLVDYILEVWFHVKFTTTCYHEGVSLRSYLHYVVPWTKAYFGYCHWVSWVFEIFRVQTKLVVYFPDLFIVTISMYLTSCFEEFNKYVVRHQNHTPPMWHILRQHYTDLCGMVKIIDKSVGFFIITSFSQNLFLICVDLFKIIRNDMAHDLHGCSEEDSDIILGSALRSSHFVFNLASLSLRIVIVGLFAARIQTVARQPAIVIYDLKPGLYDVHAKRFLEQIHTLTPSLSGHHFFFVTNKAILSMFASVITYELVILQFSSLNI